MDSHTYGNTKAAEILVEMLDRDPDYKHKVGKYWCDYSRTISQLLTANSMTNDVRIHLTDLFYYHTMDTLDATTLPEDIRTYLKNVMSQKRKLAKSFLEQLKED